MATGQVCDFGWRAPSFTLPATDGRTLSLRDIAGPAGTLVMFICNHCPYVLRALPEIRRETEALAALGIGIAAICSNDSDAYPADSFPNMRALAERERFSFPYLHDADQSVARAWTAACTPDYFGLNGDGALQYRGRLGTGSDRDLLNAMRQIAETGAGPADQIASMGCSIKWKG